MCQQRRAQRVDNSSPDCPPSLKVPRQKTGVRAGAGQAVEHAIRTVNYGRWSEMAAGGWRLARISYRLSYPSRRLAMGFAASARRTGRYVAISAVTASTTSAVSIVRGSPG